MKMVSMEALCTLSSTDAACRAGPRLTWAEVTAVSEVPDSEAAVRRVQGPAPLHRRHDRAGGRGDVQRAQRAVGEQLPAAGAWLPSPCSAMLRKPGHVCRASRVMAALLRQQSHVSRERRLENEAIGARQSITLERNASSPCLIELTLPLGVRRLCSTALPSMTGNCE